MNKEIRFFRSKILVRSAEANGAGRIIEGRAIPFDSPSLPICEEEDFAFIEYINKDAFNRALENPEAEVMFLYSHDWDSPLARRTAGRLTLEKREDGIYFKASPPDTTRAQDLIKDIEAGNIQGNSFGFGILKDRWFKNENGVDCREVLEAELLEISPVVMPAYPDTSIAKRSFTLANSAKKKTRRQKLKNELDYLERKIRSQKFHNKQSTKGTK